MNDFEITDMDIVAAIDNGFTPTDAGDMLMEAAEDRGQTADIVSLTSNSKEYRLTGRPSTQLYFSCDPDTFSDYQGSTISYPVSPMYELFFHLTLMPTTRRSTRTKKYRTL